MRAFRHHDWVRLPTRWIEQKGLIDFAWVTGGGGDQIAALLTLIAIAHRTDEKGIARITYDEIERATNVSRAKIAGGLDVLETRKLIQREPDGQSTYLLEDFDLKSGWAKLPARGLYRNGMMGFTQQFRLRDRTELNALKIYLLIVSRRSRDLNMALLNYETISNYTGLQRHQIKRALGTLNLCGLIQIERVRSWESDIGKANAYRLSHLDSNRHQGTMDVDQMITTAKMLGEQLT